MLYCIFFVGLGVLKLSPIKTQVQFPGTLQSIQCQGPVLFAEEPHRSALIWMSAWSRNALNMTTSVSTCPSWGHDSLLHTRLSSTCHKQGMTVLFCTSTAEWQKITLLSLFKPHVEGQLGLVIQKLVRNWGHGQLMPVI